MQGLEVVELVVYWAGEAEDVHRLWWQLIVISVGGQGGG